MDTTSLGEKPSSTDDQSLEQPAQLTRTKSLSKDVSPTREILVVGLISLAQFTTQMGLGQTIAILHLIGDHFGISDPGTLSWLIAGYSLTVGTFILFSGRLGDLFGWKKMLIIGYTWYGIWSIVAGLSWYSNHVLFVFARIFQGIGPAICLPNGLALLGGLYEPGKRKNMAFAVFGACAPVGSIVGSVAASLWALLWWPWTFLSFGITLLIIALLSAISIPNPQRLPSRTRTLKGLLVELDLLGSVVGVTGLILFSFAWSQAVVAGWQSPYVIVTLILGIFLIPTFIWIEVKVSTSPLIPVEVLTLDNAFILACVACGWSSFGIWYYYLWQIIEVLRGASPLLASAYLSPVAVSGSLAAILTGVLLSKLRPAWIMLFAMCAFLIGCILVATLPVDQIYWAQIFVCTVITTFGMDMSFPSATVVLSNSVEKKHQGVAASLVNTIVNYSISLGLGFAATVEVHINNGGLTDADILLGYRGAIYLGIGLAGLGVMLASTSLLISYHRRDKSEPLDA